MYMRAFSILGNIRREFSFDHFQFRLFFVSVSVLYGDPLYPEVLSCFGPFPVDDYIVIRISAQFTCKFAYFFLTVNERKKRSFHSYFENYLDEMATSVCTSLAKAGGYTFTVRRACVLGPSCHHICTSATIKKQLPNW